MLMPLEHLSLQPLPQLLKKYRLFGMCTAFLIRGYLEDFVIISAATR